MREKLTKAGLFCFFAVGAVLTLLPTGLLVLGVYELAVYVSG